MVDVHGDGTGDCVSTVERPALVLAAGVLGSLYLGGEALPRLVAAGLVREECPGAAARIDRMLRGGPEPWQADVF
ncbi:MAG TPA: sterol carrier protein domain-containing protein [Rugosimonospora sp.]|nr:sterol carrier protein domain-containing protein [Rugosimonospora sp.]